MNIDDLLRIAMERRASDLHLKVGNYPHLRIDGELIPLTDQPRVSAEDMLTMAFSMMSARQKQKFKETTEIDMAYGVAGLGRFRVNVFQQRGNVGLVLRVIPTKIRALDELYLPKVVEQVCDMPRGLVLVTGVTGSGKSTTLAAMVDRVNSSRAEHIVTIEDPIEFLHRDKKGFVNQREVEVDTPSFSSALRASLRQDPDVILVGEMRDLETAQIANRAALTGHLVLSTLHTNDAASTVARLLDMGIPPFLLSSSLRLVVAQRLIRKNCAECKQPHNIDEASLVPHLQTPRGDGRVTVFKGRGCTACNQTGLKGRIAIYEVMPDRIEVGGQIQIDHLRLPLEDRLRLHELVLLLGAREGGRRAVGVAVRADLVAGRDDVAHPVGVHLRHAAGDEERRRKPAPVEQAQQLRDADVRAVGAHRQEPRLGRGVRVARQPHLLGIEIEREGDGAAGARRPAQRAAAAATTSLTRCVSTDHG